MFSEVGERIKGEARRRTHVRRVISKDFSCLCCGGVSGG